jgi:hypothetical protein
MRTDELGMIEVITDGGKCGGKSTGEIRRAVRVEKTISLLAQIYGTIADEIRRSNEQAHLLLFHCAS